MLIASGPSRFAASSSRPAQALRTRAKWREPLDRLAVNTVLISPEAPLASLLRDDGRWQKVYEDPQAVIFTKSNPNSTLAASTTPAALGTAP